MGAMGVYAWIFPLAALAMAAAIVVGVRSSGRMRRPDALEARLRQRTFTGAERVRLGWPKDRRRPTLARLARIGEDQGYRLIDHREQEHVWVLEFERVRADEDGL